MSTSRHPELKSWRVLNDSIRDCTDERLLSTLLRFESTHRHRAGFIRRIVGRLTVVRRRRELDV